MFFFLIFIFTHDNVVHPVLTVGALQIVFYDLIILR